MMRHMRAASTSDEAVAPNRQGELAQAGERLIGPLTRFIERELARWDTPEVRVVDLVTPEDVLAATYVAALDEAAREGAGAPLFAWLRRIARREARAAAIDATERYNVELSLDDRLGGEPQTSRSVLHLIDVLADPNGELPESILVAAETGGIVNDVLAHLPERWRETFLLREVDGWAIPDIAHAEGLSLGEVRDILAASRLFLREWLQHDLHVRGSADLR